MLAKKVKRELGQEPEGAVEELSILSGALYLMVFSEVVSGHA